MKTVATLGPSVRLVVFQFLMKSAQVPTIIPPKRVSEASPLLPTISGVEVLESTPKVDLSSLGGNVAFGDDYEIVDSWEKPHERNWNLSFVRFVFCHKEHVKRDEFFTNFITQKKDLERVFVEMISNNLWATQGHLNPYFEKDGTLTGHQVLMLGCVGRVPNDWVFSGGRDENHQGIGPKVLLSRLSQHLELIDDEVSLVTPEPLTVSAPAV